MALKDLIIDQNILQEEIIEKIVSPYVRYDIDQKAVVFLPDSFRILSVQQRIIIYLVALKGWKYFEEGEKISEDVQPKEIADSLKENGSTVRSHLQALIRRGMVQKKVKNYSISLSAFNKVEDFIKK
jgi:DNA-binding MarR family transcriptional regulator